MSNQTNEREYKVFRIENGTVLDHIKSPLALKIIEILKLQHNGGILSIGINFDSKKIIKKDIIKVENVYLSKEETDLIALFSPTTTINIIKNGVVVEKRLLELPETVSNILKCPNPTCVTNNYNDCQTKFDIIKDGKNIKARCIYCERETPILPELFK